MRIPSGTTDQYIYFYAVDATDFTTPETGLSTWTVYRSRNGAAAAAFTTPTVNETDSVNMAGVYELLLDEDMTIDAGDDEQEMVFHVSHAGMAPVVRTITLFRPKITGGYTLGVASDGDISGNVDGVVTLADGAHGGSAATITAKGITVAATDAGANAVTLTGQTTGSGLRVNGGASGHGIDARVTGAAKNAIFVLAQGTGVESSAVYAESTNGAGMLFNGGAYGAWFYSAAGPGLLATGVPDISGDITGNITGNLSGSVGSLDTQAKADVNAEVLDVMTTDTFAEPAQGAPAATASLADKLAYLYKAWRNKSDQDATTYQLYNDDTTTVDHKATCSDDGTTTTKGEVATGP